ILIIAFRTAFLIHFILIARIFIVGWFGGTLMLRFLIVSFWGFSLGSICFDVLQRFVVAFFGFLIGALNALSLFLLLLWLLGFGFWRLFFSVLFCNFFHCFGICSLVIQYLVYYIQFF